MFLKHCLQDVFVGGGSIDQEAVDKVESLLVETVSDLTKLDDFAHRQMCAELENRIGMFYMMKVFTLQNSSHAFDEHDEHQLREKAKMWTLRSQKTYQQLDDQIGNQHLSLQQHYKSKLRKTWQRSCISRKITRNLGGSSPRFCQNFAKFCQNIAKNVKNNFNGNCPTINVTEQLL